MRASSRRMASSVTGHSVAREGWRKLRRARSHERSGEPARRASCGQRPPCPPPHASWPTSPRPAGQARSHCPEAPAPRRSGSAATLYSFNAPSAAGKCPSSRCSTLRGAGLRRVDPPATTSPATGSPGRRLHPRDQATRVPERPRRQRHRRAERLHRARRREEGGGRRARRAMGGGGGEARARCCASSTGGARRRTHPRADDRLGGGGVPGLRRRRRAPRRDHRLPEPRRAAEDGLRVAGAARARRVAWFGLNVDIGSLRTGDPYEEIARLAPHACTWQVKEASTGRAWRRRPTSGGLRHPPGPATAGTRRSSAGAGRPGRRSAVPGEVRTALA